MLFRKQKYLFSFFTFLFIMNQIAFAKINESSDTTQWLKENRSFYLKKINENISPPNASFGAVIAAKTRDNPNYYFHWVRDAGLVIDSLVTTYQSPTTNQEEKIIIAGKIFQYLDFSTRIQYVKTLGGLGEPKFNVDGSAFNDPWGRPQNDGPAVRALSLIHWANVLIAEGQEATVRERLYRSQMPANSPVKIDLEYISHHWQDPSYDIWEEVKGTHFYTLMVTRRALLEGAELARKLGDTSAADWYFSQGKAIEIELKKFWDAERGYIVATINRVEGLDYKTSNLDTSVILGLLYGDMNDGLFSWSDPKIIRTLDKLVSKFKEIYPINNVAGIPGTAIGRYPEDRYAGSNFNGGNPWPLCTLAIAEALYRSAHQLDKEGHLKRAHALMLRADQFVKRVKYHAHKDGSLNEQMDRYTGYMTSVSDLTWNYASMLNTSFDA